MLPHRLLGPEVGLATRGLHGRRRPVLDHGAAEPARALILARLPRCRGRALRARRLVLGRAPLDPGAADPRLADLERAELPRLLPPDPRRRATTAACSPPQRRRSAGSDPGAQIVLGGLFRYPLGGREGGIRATDYLRELYARGLSYAFDGVAIHPYAGHVSGVRHQVKRMTDVIDESGDDAVGLDHRARLGVGRQADAAQPRPDGTGAPARARPSAGSPRCASGSTSGSSPGLPGATCRRPRAAASGALARACFAADRWSPSPPGRRFAASPAAPEPSARPRPREPEAQKAVIRP